MAIGRCDIGQCVFVVSSVENMIYYTISNFFHSLTSKAIVHRFSLSSLHLATHPQYKVKVSSSPINFFFPF